MGKPMTRSRGSLSSLIVAFILIALLILGLASCAPALGGSSASAGSSASSGSSGGSSAASSGHGALANPAGALPAGALPGGAAEIAAFRGHAFRRSVPVNEVSRARLRHVIEEQLTAHPFRGDEGAFARAFGFSPLDAETSSQATARLHSEQLVGLYVSRDRAIYVRSRARGSMTIDP